MYRVLIGHEGQDVKERQDGDGRQDHIDQPVPPVGCRAESIPDHHLCSGIGKEAVSEAEDHKVSNHHGCAGRHGHSYVLLEVEPSHAVLRTTPDPDISSLILSG